MKLFFGLIFLYELYCIKKFLTKTSNNELDELKALIDWDGFTICVFF
jgi:hypothetical protein